MSRVRFLAAFVLVAAAVPCSWADPPPIRLPEVIVPAPMPPTPGPTPAPVTKLAADQWYVIDSDVPVIVLASPAGLVGVRTDPGPITLRGRFADAPGKVETRTYSGKFVVSVDALKSGRCELLIVPTGATTDADVIRRTIDVDAGQAPQPPPGPSPGPKPTPPDPKPDGTSPFAESGFRVLMVFDSTSTTRPAAQNSVIYGKAVREYMAAKCVLGPDGKTREYRIYPANTDVAADRPTWRDAFGKAGGKDWILIGDGKTGHSGPLPKTEADALALLRKYGGQ